MPAAVISFDLLACLIDGGSARSGLSRRSLGDLRAGWLVIEREVNCVVGSVETSPARGPHATSRAVASCVRQHSFSSVQAHHLRHFSHVGGYFMDSVVEYAITGDTESISGVHLCPPSQSQSRNGHAFDGEARRGERTPNDDIGGKY
ncbi:unnamed protein product [Phytophthora lilii]|uniref:Unnamed protein product n=1 Tax=Phytophthora lilii TaxID=2077276 RepID=A0A9W6TPZ1_9STRA|nr:unnamed protein product [Phytophthora lilii]